MRTFEQELIGDGELEFNNDEVSCKILDAELDVYNCEFFNDRAVTINTKDYTHITLTIDHLEDLIEKIEQSEEYFKEHFKC